MSLLLRRQAPMRSRPGPGRPRDGTENRSTGPIEGTRGLHQGGSDRSEVPSATIVQDIRSIKEGHFAPLEFPAVIAGEILGAASA